MAELLRISMPSGKPATDLTLRVMADTIRKASTSEPMRAKAIDLLQGVYALTPRDYIRAVSQFVRERVTLINEADEILICPIKMLADIEAGRAFGDCDDIVLLAGSLVRTLGLPVRLKAVFPAPEGHYQHVFFEYRFPDDPAWRPLDLTINEIPVYPPDFLTEEV